MESTNRKQVESLQDIAKKLRAHIQVLSEHAEFLSDNDKVKKPEREIDNYLEDVFGLKLNANPIDTISDTLLSSLKLIIDDKYHYYRALESTIKVLENPNAIIRDQ